MGMSIEPDPYRVLGLSRGASAEDIRRAYRRLVKENHPDSAGEKALPRFLAIQAAYEALEEGPSTKRVGGRPDATRPSAREGWRPDPDRARATRDTSRRSGRRSWDPETKAGGGTTASDGAAPRRGTRPPDAEPGMGTSGRNASPGSGPGRRADEPRSPGDRSRREGRRRAANKATLGSTSYDAAADEPFEPEWSGGTWYGASSGTYWTINPKEYADPRKHGPEYQRRARRRTAAGRGGAVPGPDEPWDDELAGTSPSGAADEPVHTDDPADDTPPPSDGPAVRSPRRRYRSAESTTGRDDRRWAAAAGPEPAREPTDGLDPFAAAAQVAMRFAGTPRGFMARVGLALIGWPAIGLALTTIAGDVTGCGRFAASCVDLFGVGTWLGQLVIIAVLLAVPSLAALSAVGSLVALAASIPTAVFLSATGGSRDRATSGMILAVVLGIAYIGGVMFALVRRRRMARLP
jgi:curved DNA-binding protein CbpA